MYMVSIDPVGLILSPPASKHTPFPMRATSIYEESEGFPKYVRFTTIGGL